MDRRLRTGYLYTGQRPIDYRTGEQHQRHDRRSAGNAFRLEQRVAADRRPGAFDAGSAWGRRNGADRLGVAAAVKKGDSIKEIDDEYQDAGRVFCTWFTCRGTHRPGSGARQGWSGFRSSHHVQSSSNVRCHLPLPGHLLVARKRASREECAGEVSRGRGEHLARGAADALQPGEDPGMQRRLSRQHRQFEARHRLRNRACARRRRHAHVSQGLHMEREVPGGLHG